MNAERLYFKNQINEKQSDLQACHQKDAEYRLNYDECLETIGTLEQELNLLLFHKKKALEIYQHLESLICGDVSPMGKIQFNQPGLLEGKFLRKVQIKLNDERREQRKTLAAMRESILEINQKIREVEDDIALERSQLIQLNDLMIANKEQINTKNMQIVILEGNIRSLSS